MSLPSYPSGALSNSQRVTIEYAGLIILGFERIPVSLSIVAKTLDEAKALIEEGFEYVCTHESLMLFRKRR